MNHQDTKTPRTRVGVVGAGQFGAHHARVLSALGALAGVFDVDRGRAAPLAAKFGCGVFGSLEELADAVDAAVVAVPTREHAEVGCALLERGLDVLVEKPIAATPEDAARLIATAEGHRRVLQVGHLERYNPAVVAAKRIVTRPMFFEVHRMSVFSPRSLDVDVVFDLMIHDLDIVHSLVEQPVEEVRAVGLAVLSPKVDIANVRLAFAGGCVANFTASRVSTEKVRKLRFFQPRQYVSVDYSRQDAVVFSVGEEAGGGPQIGFRKLETEPEEPLRAELRDFLRCVAERTQPLVDGSAALRALETARSVVAAIATHSQRLGITPEAVRRTSP